MRKQRGLVGERSRPNRPVRPDDKTHSALERDLEKASQERGERFETGKAMARGGRVRGFVPGAMEAK